MFTKDVHHGYEEGTVQKKVSGLEDKIVIIVMIVDSKDVKHKKLDCSKKQKKTSPENFAA